MIALLKRGLNLVIRIRESVGGIGIASERVWEDPHPRHPCGYTPGSLVLAPDPEDGLLGRRRLRRIGAGPALPEQGSCQDGPQ
jgi:hypothetical protein